MSRWVDQYGSHPFRANWQVVKDALDQAKVDDETIVTSVEELGRLRKVIAYIDGLLDSIDPELLPLSILDSFHSQAAQCGNEISAYNGNRSIGHIQNANANADNLLTYIRPYMVAEGKTAKALRQAAAAYSESFAEHANAFGETVRDLIRQAKSDVEEIGKDKTEIFNSRNKLTEIRNEFIGSDESEGVYDAVKKRIAEFDEKHAEIALLYDDFFVGQDGSEAKKVTLKNSVSQAVAQAEKSQSVAQKATNIVASIEGFSNDIFGEPNDEGLIDNGLSYELGQQKMRMDELEEQQKKRYVAINEKIESLLPGATSAGLASAYREMKESFDKPIQFSGRIFFAAIAVLVIGSLAFSIQSIGPQGLKLAQLGGWDTVLRSFAYKLPFYGPAVWLAYYASKRRSEYQRLQQEYAHKEALAKSYDSYKKQIDELGVPDNSLLATLMQKAIEAISHNASQTLDGKHGDKMPLQEAAEKIAETLSVLQAKST